MGILSTHGLECKKCKGRWSRHHLLVNDNIKIKNKTKIAHHGSGPHIAQCFCHLGTICIWHHPRRQQATVQDDKYPLVSWLSSYLPRHSTIILALSHLHATGSEPRTAAMQECQTEQSELSTGLCSPTHLYPLPPRLWDLWDRPEAKTFFHKLGRRLRQQTREPRCTSFLLQRMDLHGHSKGECSGHCGINAMEKGIG